MIITRADLREWAYWSGDVSLVPAPFPTRGGSYADIHHALIEEDIRMVESLVEYAWKKWLVDENFAASGSSP